MLEPDRMDVEMQWLEPRIAVLAKIVRHLVPVEATTGNDQRLENLNEWELTIDGVLTTLAGRRRWDVCRGWTESRHQWPFGFRPTDASDRLDEMVRADECLAWIRKQLGLALQTL